MKSRTAIFSAACLGFVAGVLFAIGGAPGHAPRPAAAQSEAAPEADVLPQPPATGPIELRRTPTVQAVARAAPAVVSITTEVPNQSPFRVFYGLPNATSQGSGAVIREDGVVLTNAHVVDGAVRIVATFADDSSYNARVLGLDEALDLAVLKLEDAQGLPVVPMGTSADLLLGEPVIAIGNPFGLGHTVTTGVISSPSRALEVSERVYQDYIQTDAGINPGNSGGPLLNIHGELIGINSAIRRDAENIGFAIPVDRAAKVARDLLRFGSVRAPWLGVAVEDVGGPRYANTPIAIGAVQIKTVEAAAAAAAALQAGDILLKVDQRLIRSRDDLNLYLATRTPGETVTVEGLREGKEFSAILVADRIPPETESHLLDTVLGVEALPIDAATARTYGLRSSSGLLVKSANPAGTFAKAGLRPGDAILAVNGTVVTNTTDLQRELVRGKAAHRPTVLLTIQRGPYRGHVEISI